MIGPESGAAPWWATGGLFALWLARELWGALRERRKTRTETDANIDLLNQQREGLRALADRVAAMEGEQASLRTRLEEEIRLRMQAQEEAHRLRLRVQTLENAMRQVGAVIPPEPQRQG